MNVGLTDAYGLGNTLSDILLEDGSMELLDNYEQARLAEWPSLFGAGTTLENAVDDDWVSQVASRLVPCVPATGSELSALLRQIGVAAV
jgi:2-polyprenyl-6-methoxyphenol hydroxylase-like FAD-dependent oxidoreductase